MTRLRPWPTHASSAGDEDRWWESFCRRHRRAANSDRQEPRANHDSLHSVREAAGGRANAQRARPIDAGCEFDPQGGGAEAAGDDRAQPGYGSRFSSPAESVAGSADPVGPLDRSHARRRSSGRRPFACRRDRGDRARPPTSRINDQQGVAYRANNAVLEQRPRPARPRGRSRPSILSLPKSSFGRLCHGSSGSRSTARHKPWLTRDSCSDAST